MGKIIIIGAMEPVADGIVGLKPALQPAQHLSIDQAVGRNLFRQLLPLHTYAICYK